MKLKIPYIPRKWQKDILPLMKRFSVNVLHRRSGKTVLNVSQAIGVALTCPHKNPRVAYFAATRSQAKDTAWDYFKDMLKPLFLKSLVVYNETDLTIKFKNGAKISLYSYENIENVRGIYLDLAILDEFQLGNSNIFEKVVRPMLSDRLGRCIISGTPNGRNYFYDLFTRGEDPTMEDWSSVQWTWEDTDVIDRNEIASMKAQASEDSFAQEYECSFDAATKGAFLAKSLTRMRQTERFQEIYHDPSYPVVTSWDLGFDGTVIWYAQKVGENIRIIDCDMFENKDIPFVCNHILNKPYVYQFQLVPHDTVNRSITDKTKTAKGTIEKLGLKCKLVKRSDLLNGIHATNNFIDRVVFSKTLKESVRIGKTTLSPLDHLSLYRSQYDEDLNMSRNSIVHDYSSHVADSFRTMALGLRDSMLSGTISPYSSEIMGQSNSKANIRTGFRPLRK